MTSVHRKNGVFGLLFGGNRMIVHRRPIIVENIGLSQREGRTQRYPLGLLCLADARYKVAGSVPIRRNPNRNRNPKP